MAISRQVIKPMDIQNFFGKRERQSFKMMLEMKRHFSKEKRHPITVTNFCDYYGVQPSELYESMQATDLYKTKNAENRKNKTETTSPISEVNSTKHIRYQFGRKTE